MARVEKYVCVLMHHVVVSLAGERLSLLSDRFTCVLDYSDFRFTSTDSNSYVAPAAEAETLLDLAQVHVTPAEGWHICLW